jgi:hypothetical protein
MTQTLKEELALADRCCAIIPHTAESRVLLLAGEQGWQLPEWPRDPEHDGSAAYRVNQTLAEQLGIRVHTLRCLRRAAHTEGGGARLFVYWMENASPDWQLPHGARWAPREELPSLAWASPDHRFFLPRPHHGLTRPLSGRSLGDGACAAARPRRTQRWR